MYTYTKSILNDFFTLFDPNHLENQINSSGDITTILQGVTITGDVVDITFDNQLSTPEENALNLLINSYASDETVLYKEVFNFVYHTTTESFIETSDNTHRVITDFNYMGRNLFNTPLSRIDFVVSKSSPTTGDGEIEIIDITNGNAVISSLTWSTDIVHNETVTSLTNIPSSDSILCVRFRKSGAGAGSVRIHSINIYRT